MFDPQRPQRVHDYFVNLHLTQREIGRLEGISAPAVCKILRKLGVPSTAGTHVKLVCPECGKTFTRTRALARATRTPRCSVGCYRAARRNPAFVGWRQGMRRARARVRRAGFPLMDYHVVHHVNGDQRDNTMSNLWVFASHSDHLRYHHGRTVEPLWRGAQ